MDLASVLLRELVEPDIDALCDEHDVRHPVEVGAEARRFVFRFPFLEPHRLEQRLARTGAWFLEPLPFLGAEILRPCHPAPERQRVETERFAPSLVDELE